MNEFDLLSAAINAAIKHGNHNQKLHGRRFGPDTGGGSGGGGGVAEILASDIKEVPPRGDNSGYDAGDKKYQALSELMYGDFTRSESSTFEYYQGENHIAINRGLSGKDTSVLAKAIAETYAPAMDRAMDKSRIPFETVVYRGLRASPEDLKNLTTPGSIIGKAGYTSTTTNIDTAAAFAGMPDKDIHNVVMHIRVPAGARAVHIGNAVRSSDGGDEAEILIHRNSKMIIRGYRVQRYMYDRGGYKDIVHVDAELLPEDAA